MSLKDQDTESIESLSEEIKKISEVVRLDCLILLLYGADTVARYLDSHMKKYGHDQTRFNILYLLISNNGIMTPTEISRKVYRSKHAITRAIDILEKDKLVKRTPSSDDRRSINVTISKKGTNFVKRSLPDLQGLSSEATSCLTNDQVEQLKTISRKLRKWLSSKMQNDF